MIFSTLAATLVAGTALGLEYTWTNTAADNDYLNGDNWTSIPDVALPPVTGFPEAGRHQMVIDLAGDDKAVMAEGDPVNISAIRIGYNGLDGEFEQTGGSLLATFNSNDASRVGRNGVTGSWTMSGGSASINGIQLGLSGGTGNMVITGGDLLIARGVRSAELISTSLSVGFGGVGNFSISGGSILTRVGAQVGAQGTFEVVGTGATDINIGGSGSADGFWIQDGGGVLRPGITGDGVTPISIAFVDGAGLNGDVTFRAGAILDPYDAGGAKAGWITVMSWGGTVTDEGLALSQDAIDGGWEMRIVEKELQVKNTPGPGLQISDISYDKEFDQFSLTWNVSPGSDYILYFTDVLGEPRRLGDLGDAFVDNDGLDSNAEVGRYTYVFEHPVPGAARLFFTVEENP
ncbi:MAG: hypothetical protein ACSHYF_15815 [Verrucomicrobiaceae bacterium]